MQQVCGDADKFKYVIMNIMKIAIVNKSFDNHFVCLGMLLEALKEHQVTVFTKTNFLGWIQYYESIYTFTTVFNIHIDVPMFDKIIKLSSHDDCFTDVSNVISILHLQCFLVDDSRPFISCTPYVTGANVHYMFPIFRPIMTKSSDKIVTLVGYYLNDNIDADTDAFIQMNRAYTFMFITGGDVHYNNLTKHDNVRLLHRATTPEMFDILNKSRFVLSKKFINYDRYSGQLGMAMSLEKPLIIDAKTATAYNLPGLTFASEYSEIGLLDNITDDKYDTLVEDIRKFNTVCHNDNYQTMQKLLSLN